MPGGVLPNNFGFSFIAATGAVDEVISVSSVDPAVDFVAVGNLGAVGGAVAASMCFDGA